MIAGSVDSSASRCSGKMVRPRAAITARARVFSSCRTLPGQGRCLTASRASADRERFAPAVRPLDTLQDIFGQRLDIVGAVAERRDDDPGDVEPVIKVLAESAGRDLLGEVAVCRRDDARVGAEGLSSADALELTLLDDAEDLDLGRQGQLADLVEKDRSSGRAFEPPGLLAVGPGERAALVAEQFALDEPLGECAAIDANKRSARAIRMAMERGRDQLFASAAFTEDQDRARRSRRQVRSSCRPRASRHSGRSARARISPPSSRASWSAVRARCAQRLDLAGQGTLFECTS